MQEFGEMIVKKYFLYVFLMLFLVLVTSCSDYQRGKICGTHDEKYTSNVKGCDGIENCRCLHESWGGLGACDSCECTRQVSDC